ncbi:MAG: prolyl oligopeptidase family serine peptidase, partial [Candidatus Zixiibacteriota bacterium]
MFDKHAVCRFSIPGLLVLFAGLVLLFTFACDTGSDLKEVITIGAPPETRVENVTEEMFGHKVEDPYRWLENRESEDVKGWVDQQNQYTRSALDNLSNHKKIGERLEKLFSIGYIASPKMYKGRYFHIKREGKQNQPVLYVRDGLQGRERVLIDPNAMDEEGLVALDWWFPSEDGKLLAYGLSREGTEQSTLYVLDVKTGAQLPDVITRTRYTALSWKSDNTGFYYSRLPAAGTVPEGEESYHRHIFYHELGTDPESDPKVFGEGREMTEWLSISFSPDDRYLLLSIFMGWDKTDIYFQELKSSPESVRPEGFIPVAVGTGAIFNGQIVGDNLYLHTNYQAGNYRFIRVDLKAPAEENWEELIGEDESVLEYVAVVGDRLVARYMQNASSRLKVFSLSGAYIKDIELPTLGSVYDLHGEWDGSEILFCFNSYFIPPTVYHYDLKAEKLSLYQEVESDLDTSPYQVEQVWYESKDGTKVSMFLVHQKGIKLDGSNPTMLSGYGGFNSPATPSFHRNRFLWLEHGGVLAIPNLRGGSEYGERWHKDGMLGNKQNVFDDFIAAAEWLIENGYTSPSKLVIRGGSNGGLLVGAVMTQRPDLCKAVICWNPLLDMTRYHHFLIAKLWIYEYGSPEDSVQFQWLYAYSPYHRVVDGTPYPATLLLTADSDTRVDPMHAKKMAARLQTATSSDAPILLRIATKAGHGAGTPLSKSIEEYTDSWTFIFWQ